MLNRYSWVLAAVIMVVLAVSPRATEAPQQPASAPVPDVQTLGPQPGERVPDFTLQDQHGARRTLASLMGPKGLILVFNRSVDW